MAHLCTSLYTAEVDYPEIACSEILKQLDAHGSLRAHTVGIIMCHPEFIATGVLDAVCACLPFDLVGITTASQAVNGETGELLLTVFVMTSDDTEFVTGVAEHVGDDIDGPLAEAYGKIAATRADRPKLAIIFPPFGLHPGDAYIRAWEHCIPGTPVFGTCASSDALATFAECDALYNGVPYRDAMPFVLCYGDIAPRFMLATLSRTNAVSPKAHITKAEGNCVYEIDNDTALAYFTKIGFVHSVIFTPFMIDLLQREDYDGVPVIRGHASFTEDGAALFYGDVDAGSTFTMLACDPDDILTTTRQALDRINNLPDVNGALLFPCAIRRAGLLGANRPLAELHAIKETIRSDIPFMAGYAGGEFCPTSVTDGIPTNRFHNYSLVILIV